MIRSLPLLLSSSLLCLSAIGQTPAIQIEQWEENPSLHTISGQYDNEPAVVLLDKRRIEYIDDDKQNVIEYYTQHRLVHVMDDNGVEYFNKVYLPVDEITEIKDIHARTILPNGQIMELDRKNIKDLKEENGRVYKIFAMEGLEKGCEVEFYYTIERKTNYFGHEILQGKIPVVTSSVELVYPQRLVFDCKPYNCRPVTKLDSLSSGKTVMKIVLPELESADEEKYSAYTVNLARIEYKLSYNNAKKAGERLFTWNDLAKRIYANYTATSDKELKMVNELVSKQGWDRLGNDSVKIVTIENWMKSNLVFRDDISGKDANNLDLILRNRIASPFGVMRLYTAVFKSLAVNFQIVLAADRDVRTIEKDFENWDNCDYPLFYFPGLNHYIAPTKSEYRYPWIEPTWAAANGLYCKSVSIGTMNTAMAEVKTVPLEDYRQTYNNMDINLEMNGAMDSLIVDTKFIFGGYTAPTYRQAFQLTPPERQHEIFREMARNVSGSETILSSGIENADMQDANRGLPFIIKLKIRSGELTEKAGNKILLKVGLAIGPQVQMYQEKARQTPIKMEFPHLEERRIRFKIPAGYAIKNLDDLKFEQVYKENGEQTMGFISTYEVKDNILTVNIREDYRRTIYPISQYQDFVRIINTSSDFNKVVLVLEKK